MKTSSTCIRLHYRWKQASAKLKRYCAMLTIGGLCPEVCSCDAGNVNPFTYSYTHPYHSLHMKLTQSTPGCRGQQRTRSSAIAERAKHDNKVLLPIIFLLSTVSKRVHMCRHTTLNTFSTLGK